jgi:hypothetical protein
LTFIILAVLAFLIVLVFRKYKTVASVIITILLAIGITTVFLAAGIITFTENRVLVFFNSTLGHSDYFYLIAAWYGADILCSILIIRNHIAYKKINPDRSNQ